MASTTKEKGYGTTTRAHTSKPGVKQEGIKKLFNSLLLESNADKSFTEKTKTTNNKKKKSFSTEFFKKKTIKNYIHCWRDEGCVAVILLQSAGDKLTRLQQGVI